MKKILLAVVIALITAITGGAVKMSDLKIYINPGHGGYGSDDRNIGIYPYAGGDTLGYWESKSNLYKGLFMYHILDSLGAKPYLSRIKNTEADDRELYSISQEANELGCDLFFSIHSNAGENVNYPLMLYREDAVGKPRYTDAVRLSNILWDQLHSSKLSLWTRDTPYVSGDLTFYPQWGTSGLGVLRRLYVVGLLSEGGMHEHRPEAHRLMNMDFCWLEAWHFVKTIMEFYDTTDRFVTGNVAGVVYDSHNTREETLNLNNYTAYGRDRNKPLNGASVKLLDASGAVVQTRTTDKDNNGVFVFRNVKPGNYTVEVSCNGYYMSRSDVVVTANEVTYNDVPLLLKREMPLTVVDYSPKPAEGELVSCAEKIKITFNTDVDETTFLKAVSLEPSVAGKWTFSKSFTEATFTPEVAFDLSTHYKLSISTEARTPDVNYAAPNLQSPFVMEFDTKGRNRLELIQSYPSEGDAVHYTSPTLEFRFDKTLNASNIYDLIKVTDSSGKELSVNRRTSTYNKLTNGYGNVMLAMISSFTVGEKYKVTLDGEIRDSEGIPLGKNVEINFVAENQGETHQGEVIETFEAENVFAGNETESTGVNNVPTYYRYTSKHLFDAAAGRFYYSYTNASEGVAVWDYKGDYHVAVHGAKLGMYVFGDLNAHELSVGFSSGTDIKYIKVCNMDFLGWRYFEVPLDELLPDFEYLLVKIKLTQHNSLYAQSGGFNIDNIIYDDSQVGGVADAVTDSGISVFPNPATDEVHLAGAEADASVEIYNTAGALVKTAVGNVVNVRELHSGVYFMKIARGDTAVVKTLTVK